MSELREAFQESNPELYLIRKDDVESFHQLRKNRNVNLEKAYEMANKLGSERIKWYLYAILNPVEYIPRLNRDVLRLIAEKDLGTYNSMTRASRSFNEMVKDVGTRYLENYKKRANVFSFIYPLVASNIDDNSAFNMLQKTVGDEKSNKYMHGDIIVLADSTVHRAVIGIYDENSKNVIGVNLGKIPNQFVVEKHKFHPRYWEYLDPWTHGSFNTKPDEYHNIKDIHEIRLTDLPPDVQPLTVVNVVNPRIPYDHLYQGTIFLGNEKCIVISVNPKYERGSWKSLKRADNLPTYVTY